MSKFFIGAERADGHRTIFEYDNMTSELTQEGVPVEVKAFQPMSYVGVAPAVVVSKDKAGQKRAPAVLKIQLGLLCNYECGYCNQRFVKHSDQTNNGHIEPFLKTLKSLDTSALNRIEFWGGEPLVYWKVLKPLASRLRQLFPKVEFVMITNGSLLDRAKNIWLDAMGFTVAISHDGPGQCERGPDPLDDPESREGILDLYRRLHPQGRISINAMIHAKNTNRAAVSMHLRAIFGDDVRIGEGSVIDPYDDSALALSFTSEHDQVNFRRAAYNEIAGHPAMENLQVMDRVREIVDSIANRRPAMMLGQKCGMDRADQLAVDLRGNVLTCQNVSTAQRAPNGESHNLGHIRSIENVRMRSSTHWSERAECSDCPVLQSCKGSCMFLDGKLWEAGCDNAFSDHLPFFAAAIAYITGYLPRYIEGPQRDSRKDIFGMMNGVPKKRRVIPIMPVA